MATVATGVSQAPCGDNATKRGECQGVQKRRLGKNRTQASFKCLVQAWCKRGAKTVFGADLVRDFGTKKGFTFP